MLICLIGGEALILQLTSLDGIVSQERTAQPGDKKQSCGDIEAGTSYHDTISHYGCVFVFKNLKFIDAYHDTINSFSTLLVAIFTFTLWRSTNKLWLAGEGQISAAKTAASAARDSANAMVVVERAHIIEIASDTDAVNLFMPAERYPNSPSDIPFSHQVDSFCTFKNFGRTPATILAHSCNLEILQEPPTLDEERYGLHVSSQVVLNTYTLAQDELTKPVLVRKNIDLSWVVSNQLVRRQISLWFFGHVAWQDVFGQKYIRRFIWKYDRRANAFRPHTVSQEQAYDK